MNNNIFEIAGPALDKSNAALARDVESIALELAKGEASGLAEDMFGPSLINAQPAAEPLNVESLVLEPENTLPGSINLDELLPPAGSIPGLAALAALQGLPGTGGLADMPGLTSSAAQNGDWLFQSDFSAASGYAFESGFDYYIPGSSEEMLQLYAATQLACGLF